MKFRAIIIGLVLAVAPGVVLGAAIRPDDEKEQQVERSIPADSSVVVSLCVMSGNITVRGWDRNEVQAKSGDAVQIELKRSDAPATVEKAKKLEVVVVNKGEEQQGKPAGSKGDCQAYSDVELNVPRGATVLVQTRDGNIDIAEIASAYAGTQNGDINLEQISRSIEAGSIGGSIGIKDSSGRVSATTAGGPVEAVNVKPAEPEDVFEVVTISGDITLEQVTHKQLNTKTVSGNMSLTGPLAAAGRYGFNSFSGDVMLALPADASFRLNAKISQDGDIITDFPLTLSTQPTFPTPAAPANPPMLPASGTPEIAPATPPAPPAPRTPEAAPGAPVAAPKVEPATVAIIKVSPSGKGVIHIKPAVTVVTSSKVTYSLRRVSAVHGTGDATISVSCFSGTLHLQQN